MICLMQPREVKFFTADRKRNATHVPVTYIQCSLYLGTLSETVLKTIELYFEILKLQI